MMILTVAVFLIILSLSCTLKVNRLSNKQAGYTNALSVGSNYNAVMPMYTNPDFSKDDIKQMWNSMEPLMTIGTSGVKDSHVNSLTDLTKHHSLVRIKLASDKIDAIQVANQFVLHEKLLVKLILIEVRKRGFLVKRT